MMKKVSMNIYSGSLDTHIHTVNSLSADMQKVMPTCTHVCTRMHLHVYTHTQSSQQTAHGSIRRITVKQTSILTSAAETDYLTFISSGVSSPVTGSCVFLKYEHLYTWSYFTEWLVFSMPNYHNKSPWSSGLLKKKKHKVVSPITRRRKSVLWY